MIFGRQISFESVLCTRGRLTALEHAGSKNCMSEWTDGVRLDGALAYGVVCETKGRVC